MTQALLPQLRAAKGRIVNIGSIGGRMALPYISPYNASKFALRAFTDSLRMEMGRFGIAVALVEPGSVKTPIWDKSGDTIGEARATMRPEDAELYGDVLDTMERVVAETSARGMPVEEVAKAIEHALLSAKPKTKYVLGGQAKVQAVIAALLPDRASDRVILKQMQG